MKLNCFPISFLTIMMSSISNAVTARGLRETIKEAPDIVAHLRNGQPDVTEANSAKKDHAIKLRDLQQEPVLCGDVDVGFTGPLTVGAGVGCATPMADFDFGADATLKCFASHVTADVESKGKVQMKHLQVGDKVLTSSGEYKMLYSINHHHATKPAKFIQIHHSSLLHDKEQLPLEMTKNHMIFLEGNDNPIPAFKVKVGDMVQTLNGPSTVTMVGTVIRNGFYNPLTVDGTIVVNGVIASSYAAFLSDNEWVGNLFGVTLISHQSLYDKILKPYRYVCTGVSLKFCETSHEMNKYSQIGLNLFNYWKDQHKFVQEINVILLVFFVFLLDIIISPYAMAFVGVFAVHRFVISKLALGAKMKFV